MFQITEPELLTVKNICKPSICEFRMAGTHVLNYYYMDLLLPDFIYFYYLPDKNELIISMLVHTYRTS